METVLRKWRPPGRTSGEMSFPRIRRNGWLYVDKTSFLRPLEDERYAFFIRPRQLRQVLRWLRCWSAATGGTGRTFYRNFFATLKAGTGEAGGLERLFITGVSPITMDDVTSGWIPPAWVMVLQSVLPRYGRASCGLDRP